MNYSSSSALHLSNSPIALGSSSLALSSEKMFGFQRSNMFKKFGNTLIQGKLNYSKKLTNIATVQSTGKLPKENYSEKINSTQTKKQNKTYDFKQRLYTSYSKFTEVKLVTIGIASPLRILQWAEKTLPNGKIYGEVLNANTLHHKTFKPQKGGLFCERIFGPLKDFECSCGKIDKTAKYSLRQINRGSVSGNEIQQISTDSNSKDGLQDGASFFGSTEGSLISEQNNESKKSLSELNFGLNKDKLTEKATRKLRKFCPDCDVEYTWSVIRRYQLGYIKLISPVTHIWFLKGTPSYLSILLDIKKRHLQSITYCSETFTIEHSDSAASALQTYKTSGFDLDSPSKIYASWSKAKNMESNFPINQTETESLTSLEKDVDTKSAQKDHFSDSKHERLRTIEKWKKTHNILPKDHFLTQENSFIPQALPSETSESRSLRTAAPSKIKETVNSFWNDIFSFDESMAENQATLPQSSINRKDGDKTKKLFDSITFFSQKRATRLMAILQLSLIYNDLVQSFFSNNTFNLQNLLIQKILSEKQHLLNATSASWAQVHTENPQSDNLSDSIFSQNGTEKLFKNPSSTSTKYYSDLDIEQTGPAHIIKEINKQSRINFYIKSSLQRMLHKKIVLSSIVKTWQNLYKKAYLKAMYKTLSYFLIKQGVNEQRDDVNVSSSNLHMFSNYYKINRIYASQTTLKYLNKIIRIVKSYFKKSILLTLQNLKQPIFSSPVIFGQTKNYMMKSTPISQPIESFYYTEIPIPYSSAQLINKKSEEMINFLSLDTNSLVDFLSEKGFMAPLVLGKLFGQSIHSPTFSLANKGIGIILENNDTLEYPSQTQNSQSNKTQKFVNSQKRIRTKKDFSDFSIEFKKYHLNYKLQLYTTAKNLLSALDTFDISQGQINEKQKSLPLYRIEANREGLFDSFESFDSFDRLSIQSKGANRKDPLISSKWKRELSKLLPFNLLKQSYFDLHSINNGKYPLNKKESKFLSNFTLPTEEYRRVSSNSKNTEKKRLYNNVYTLSHRERWGSRVNEGKDWEIFLLYNMGAPFSKPSPTSHLSSSFYKDEPIFAYKDRISSTAFNSQIYNPRTPPASGTPWEHGSANELNQGTRFSSSVTSHEGTGTAVQNKQPYGVLINNSFFSGPGIVQQLLNELTFPEMKKLDKQNRLLLYVLNKSIFRLKKHIKIFIFDKASQIEMKELCKKRDLLIRRTKLVRKLFRKDSDPSSMILTVLPVLPPDLRPIVKMGGQIAASDLNRFYQRVIYRNDRLKKFLKDPATSHSYEMKYAQRLLQEAVDNLIQNSQSSGEKDSRGRALKSLSDVLKGKQGRFRQFLLGKRVDYSGRSVIVVGPKLKLYECGIPLEMALELYLPFLLKNILNKNYAKTVVGAKALIKNNRPLAFELLREIMQVSPVLLNRAPTLHRLGFQAFVPKLVEGRAILLHPLVCSSFNADFDGDQMAVHVPITIEARAEAWKLMLSRNNLLSPATGDPLSIPSQDMVLGCYYLTTNSNKSTLSHLRGSGLFFTDLETVLYAYNLQKIDLHAIVWVKWDKLIENGNDQEEPVEIRLSNLGHWQELSYNYIRHFDATAELIHQYMATTPGRILFHSLLHSI